MGRIRGQIRCERVELRQVASLDEERPSRKVALLRHSRRIEDNSKVTSCRKSREDCKVSNLKTVDGEHLEFSSEVHRD